MQNVTFSTQIIKDMIIIHVVKRVKCSILCRRNSMNKLMKSVLKNGLGAVGDINR